jgi:hypothetical protein
MGDVQAGAGHAAVVQRLQQGLVVDQRAAGDVDQVQAGLGGGQHLAADQALGLRRGGGGQHDVVAAGEQGLQVGHALDARGRDRLVRAAGGDDVQAQGLGARGQGLADRPEADQAQGGAGDQLQRLRRPALGLVDPDVGQALGVGQDRGQGELGQGDGRRAARRGHHRAVEQPVGIEVDADRDQLHPLDVIGPAGRRLGGQHAAGLAERRGDQDLGVVGQGRVQAWRHGDDLGVADMLGEDAVEQLGQLAGDDQAAHWAASRAAAKAALPALVSTTSDCGVWTRPHSTSR